MWRTNWRLFVLLTILTGYGYPLLMTGLAQLCFPWQANGSMLSRHGQIVGSRWIGQNFNSEAYFWSRPSEYAYNGLASGGSNLGPANPKLISQIQARIAQRHFTTFPIPSDLVLASASGLDPEISPAAAYYQMARIAQARHISITQLQTLIQQQIASRTFGFLGEPRVNVLELNLALDNRTIGA
jgi:K+-transporting ATPase ATPase C chain